jgi:GAF domain-containing protein
VVIAIDTEKIAATFVRLADTLVSDFDVVDVLHVLVDGCVDLLGVSAAGLMLADEQGRLQVMMASSDSARLLELLQLQNDEGPCLDCYRTGDMLPVEYLEEAQDRWPAFASQALAMGYGSVHALPMRLRGETIGGLNLFTSSEASPVEEGVWSVAQAMADTATITILQDRVARGREMVNEQLQTALNSRITVEQAKGVLAARLDVDMGEAFELLRSRARSTRRRLTDVATEVVTHGADSELVRQLSR